jgi:hypothetical protein
MKDFLNPPLAWHTLFLNELYLEAGGEKWPNQSKRGNQDMAVDSV